jgi:hypothetical protein
VPRFKPMTFTEGNRTADFKEKLQINIITNRNKWWEHLEMIKTKWFVTDITIQNYSTFL